MSFDVNTPVRTKDGRKARILCTDRKCKSRATMLALVEGTDGVEELHYYYPDGAAFSRAARGGGSDLVSATNDKQVVGVYRRRDGTTWSFVHPNEDAARNDLRGCELVVILPLT